MVPLEEPVNRPVLVEEVSGSTSVKAEVLSAGIAHDAVLSARLVQVQAEVLSAGSAQEVFLPAILVQPVQVLVQGPPGQRQGVVVRGLEARSTLAPEVAMLLVELPIN